MTLREFVAALAAFFVLYILFVAVVIAAPKWKPEVGIAAWCTDLEIIRLIVKADINANPEVGDRLAARAFQTRRCIRLPLPVAAFRPSGIAAEFSSFGGRPVTVIKGNLVMQDESLGHIVFVVVPREKVSNFLHDAEASFAIDRSAQGRAPKPAHIASEFDRLHVQIS